MRKKMIIAGLCMAGVLLFGACTPNSSETQSSNIQVDESSSDDETLVSDEQSRGKEEETTEVETTEEEILNTDELTSSEETSEETEDSETSETEETESQSEIPETEQNHADVVFEDVNYNAYVAQNVNLRTTPENKGEENLYTTLTANTAFVVTGYQNDWCRVLYNNEIYYIATAYVLEGEVPAVSPNVSTGNEVSAQSQTFENGTTLTIPSENYNGIIVAVDAGHQQHGISETEPNAPGSDVMKAKLTTGTQGCVTGITEYELNLQVSLKLKQDLLNRGYGVYMIRETHDCPMSNAERAVAANGSGASIFVRVHTNSLDNPDVSGVLSMAPTAENPYVGYLSADSFRLSSLITDGICATTGAVNKGVMYTDTMTGINWCTIPVTIVEMGFMSNPTEDQLMAQDYYRQEIADGIANGIDAYFGR